MNFSHNIIGMNKKAVGCLLQGDNDGAVQTLGMALSTLQLYHELETAAKTHIGQQTQPEEHGMNAARKTQYKEFPSLPENLLSSLATTNHSDSPMTSVRLTHNGMTDCSSGTFCVFNRALIIHKDELYCRGNDYKASFSTIISHHYDRLLAVLLYNMGLSLHLQSLRSGRSAELKGALDLYEMSLSVVETSWLQFDVDDLMLLMAALFNNLEHIHSNLYNIRQGETCIEWLRVLAGHPPFQKLMQREEYSPFFMNLLVVLKQQSLMSPAA